MGLDTTHNCWHGPYSSFNRFRHALGKQIGIDLNDYIGYSDKGTLRLEDIKHDLMPLFNHSDCDGKLTIRECRKIAKGLQQVLDNLKEDEKSVLEIRPYIIQFRDGCLDAVSKKQQVHFR